MIRLGEPDDQLEQEWGRECQEVLSKLLSHSEEKFVLASFEDGADHAGLERKLNLRNLARWSSGYLEQTVVPGSNSSGILVLHLFFFSVAVFHCSPCPILKKIIRSQALSLRHVICSVVLHIRQL